MPWIRFDCSTLDDDWIATLSGDEFKAWVFFLLRVKSVGARGRVRVTSPTALSRTWGLPESAIRTMLDKAGTRIKEANGTWYVTNWSRYQDDHKGAKGEIPGDADMGRDGATPPHTTPQDTTPQEKLVVDEPPARKIAKTPEELRNAEFVLRLHNGEFEMFVQEIKTLIARENQHRTRNPFVWTPTATGGIEADLRGLIYRMKDEDKLNILYAAYKTLGEKWNWAEYVKLAVKYTVKTSTKTPIREPFKFVMAILRKPGELSSAKADGRLSVGYALAGVEDGET
jgi:hypothetical protein